MLWIWGTCEVDVGAVEEIQEELVGHGKVVDHILAILVELNVATIVGNVAISSAIAHTRPALHWR